ncbi:MAG: DUF2867 domain-containing protein [Odoribacteraceae bacterium]|jgi:hypothetical protein|nr:DUF2867 domain-containing protein [Odoribacteraceae bacterium]
MNDNETAGNPEGQITKSTLPVHSLARNYLPADYVDVFATEVHDDERLTPADLLIAVWTDFPKWVQRLFQLRDCIVKPFGLKTSADEKDFRHQFEEIVRNGGRFQLMNVLAKSANEIIVQLADTHLTAEMSVHTETSNANQLKINFITIVHFHNVWGKVYFFFVRPFHKMIVKTALKRSITKLIKQ